MVRIQANFKEYILRNHTYFVAAWYQLRIVKYGMFEILKKGQYKFIIEKRFSNEVAIWYAQFFWKKKDWICKVRFEKSTLQSFRKKLNHTNFFWVFVLANDSMLPSFFAHLQQNGMEPLKEQVTLALESAIPNDKPVTKVIIVGAGISGIAAARRLRAYSESKPIHFQVTVLEAKHFVGGR